MKKFMLTLVGVFFALTGAQNTSAQEGGLKINGGVLNGKAVVLAKADYPPAAKAVDARGAVSVQVVIDEKGEVISASAVSGHPLLRPAAEKAARQSKFTPTLLSGKAVKVAGILIYNFRGEGASEAAITAGVVNGRAKVLPKPEYTEELKKAGAEGTVTIQIVIDENGDVTSAQAVSGDDRLKEISEQAALKAKFEPSLQEGKAVKVVGLLVYNFAAAPDTRPLGKALNAPSAEYPPAAKAVGASGKVQVKVVIDEKGNVVSAESVSGHALLRAASEKAALSAKFEPTVLSGKAVEVTRVLTYDFADGGGKMIEDSEQNP